MPAGVGAWCTEGFQMLLELLNDAQATPTNYYIWLVEDATIAVNANLASLTPISGDGYSPQAVASNGTDLVSATDGANGWQLTTKAVRFQSTGGAWDTAKHAILATTSDTSGKLLAKLLLNGSTGVTNPAGYYFDVQLVLKQPVPA